MSFELHILIELARIRDVQQRIERKLGMVDKNLDQVAADVAALTASVGKLAPAVTANNAKIADLAEKLKGVDTSDPRADDLHKQITAAIAASDAAVAQLTQVADTAAAGAPATPATGSATPGGTATTTEAPQPAAAAPPAGLQSVPPNP